MKDEIQPALPMPDAIEGKGYVVTSDNRVIRIKQEVYSQSQAVAIANKNLQKIIDAINDSIYLLGSVSNFGEIVSDLQYRKAAYVEQQLQNRGTIQPKEII